MLIDGARVNDECFQADGRIEPNAELEWRFGIENEISWIFDPVIYFLLHYS